MHSALLLLPLLAIPFLVGHGVGRDWPVGWQVDGVSASLLLLTLGLTAVVGLYARRNLGGQQRRRRFFALLTLTGFGLTLLTAGSTLLAIAIGWTVSGHAAAALVAHNDRPAPRRAARRMRLAMLASDLLVWSAVAWAAMAGLPAQVGSAAVAGTTAVALLLVLAGIPRAALPPMHRWLPETAEAPSPVSALLHAGIVNGGGIVVLRLWPWFAGDGVARLLLALAGGAAIIVGTWSALVRRDVKGTLASSTTAQMGYLAAECAAGLPAAAFLHLLGHGCYKAWCFLRAGGAITRTRAHGLHAPHLQRPALSHLSIALAPVALLLVFGPRPAWASVGLALLALVVGLAALRDRSAGSRRAALSSGFAVAVILSLQGFLERWWDAQPWWPGLALGALALLTTTMGALHLQRQPNGRLSARLRAHIPAPGVRAVPSLQLPPLGDAETAQETVRLATAVVAPAWPLRAAVAANPLRGLEDMAYPVARAFAADAMGVRPHPPIAEYLGRFEQGDITWDDLAAESDGKPVEEILARARAAQPAAAERGIPISADALEHAGVWCQAAWADAALTEDPWALWRRSLGIEPEDPAAALAGMLREVPDPDAYARDLLVAAPGWASHAAWRAERNGTLAPLLQLLALRAALARALPGESLLPVHAVHPDADLWQRASERAHRRTLLSQLSAASEPMLPRAQVLACIDVRSERLRRALEASGPYATYGIAGFFGVVVRTEEAGGAFDRCPVLVQPQRTLAAATHQASLGGHLRDMADAVMHAPVTPLVGAELGGLGLAAVTVGELVAPRGLRGLARRVGLVPDPWNGPRGVVDVAEAADAVESVLRGIGLVQGFAPTIVVLGHGASITNNAYAAAYDCGACGGNSGHVNAALLADAMNDAAVRAELAHRGIPLPADTVAVAAVHDTTTDEVLFDPRSSLDVSRLQSDFATASAAVRRERLATLPGDRAEDDRIDRAAVQRRASDWSEPFPEWGLAGNGAIIVGPRHLTHGSDLAGRAFLHSYRPDLDADGSVLAGILTAPVVVAQWINAQYNWSTIDPERLGAGDKATHNAVGDIGVLTGAHGDLRLGLPWQSLFAADPRLGTPGRHQPLRLQVVVFAPMQRIDDVLKEHASIGRLVAHEWVTLTAIDPATGAVSLRLAAGGWVPEHASASAVRLGRERVHRREAAHRHLDPVTSAQLAES